MKRLVMCLSAVCLLALSSLVASRAAQTGVRVTKDRQGYWFTEGDTKVLFYQAERKALPDGQAARSNYFHPLYDLDGNVVTEDFPKDHIHHRGIFWAWHQVRINGKTVQDQWANRDSFWMIKDAQVDSDDRAASLALRVVWESPLFTDDQGRRRPFVEERSVTRVHRAEGAIRKIDFHQRLTALVDGVEIGGSDDAKGYGGFSYRVVMPPDIRFTGAEGVVTPIENAVGASPWMDVSGTYGTSGKSGLTVLTHPSTTGFPQQWILRARSSMQNAVYPGRQPVAIPRDRPVILNYRVVLHRGELAAADITRLQAEYAKERLAQDAAGDARTAFEQANALFEKTENEKALAAYDKAIVLDSKQPEYHVGRCRTLARLMRHQDAIGGCTDALKLDPNNAPAFLERGHFLINVRHAEKALPDLLQARKLGADAYGVAYHLSLAYYVTGDFKRAAEEYEQCYPNAKTDDNRVGCLAWQYLALLRAGRKADADKILERITPDTKVQSSVAYLDRLLLFKGAKKEEDAAQLMQKDNLQLPTVAYGIGVWHLVNGRQDRAREYFEKATTPPAQQSGFGSVASYYELQRMRR